MKRFRFTILALCLLLLWLGLNDILLFLRNRSPATVALAELERQGPPRSWLHVTGGWIDLEKAISTSGSLQLDALLVPLAATPEERGFRVLVETRDPRLLDLFRTYHFGVDSAPEQERFLADHREEFHARRDITGTIVTGLVASGNRDKLMQLARNVGMEVPEDVLFIAEGKEPPRYRGFFFAGLGLLGALRLVTRWRQRKVEPTGENDLTLPPAE